MKNSLNKSLIITLSLSIILLIIIVFFNQYKYYEYTKNFNIKIDNLIDSINKKYPNVTKDDLIEILNNNRSKESGILKYYGIDIKKDSAILENDKKFKYYTYIDIILLIILISTIVIIFLKYNRNKDKEIEDIIKLIEQINHRNYKLDIDNISEGKLSILKNEIYKTTIMLKEQAMNSLKDKLKLKDSLSDISHQLKTPLTSILITLDNIIDNQDIDKLEREKFILNIKREISNINFLVQSLLKLSKFEVNSINFVNEEVSLDKIIDESIKNVSTICDLKNVNINKTKNNKLKINCDFKWQVEAITNILKNCIEYSNINSSIDILLSSNNIYKEIKIIDYGKGIEKKDIPHIFERFYRSTNQSKDSIGIGLALAKAIIEKENGSIEVNSILGVKTEFIIKYYQV